MRFGQGAVLGASLLSFAPMAQAANQDFTIVNRTGYEINDIWVSRASGNDWGRELMGRGNILSDGESFDVSFPNGTRACRFDLRVRYTDNETAVWNDMDICSISRVSLFYDRKAGGTRARTE